ncbi:MAG: RNA polymerase sigma factor [Planctomycetota bacterium]
MRDRAIDRLFGRFRDRHDGAALAAVFDATSRELFDVACHLIRDPIEAEDLVQATFVAAIRRAREYDGSAPLRGWLYGILWREAARARRNAARRADPDRLVERREPEPIEGLLASELPFAVQRALDELPAHYRDVLVPLLREGRAPDEIARTLRRSAGTVRSQIHRGLGELRRALPRDLVPTTGLVAVQIRGLVNVRGEVLRAAGFSPAVAAGASTLLIGSTIGGLVMSKAMFVATTAALSVAAIAWFASDGDTAREDALLVPSTAHAGAVDASASAGIAANHASLAEDASSSARTELASDSSAGPELALQDEIDRWLARFNEAPADWRHGLAVAGEIAKLPPDRALAVMTGVWPKLSLPAKEQVLKPFVFGRGHVHALKLLHVAATDAELSVQSRAFVYLRNYAFQDFANDYASYLSWAATYRDMPVQDVLARNATRYVHELRGLPRDELVRRLKADERLDLDTGGPAGLDLAAMMRTEGALDVLAACLESDDSDAKRRALEWSKELQADEAWLRTWVLPSLEAAEHTDARTLDASLRALARRDCKWAQDPILTHLRRASAIEPPAEGDAESGPRPLPGTTSAASAIAEIGDPAAIPALIEILVHDRSGRLNYDVGYFGLAKLTGVKWQESYDAAWWLEWWDKNSQRLPPEVRSIAIRR